MQTASTALRMLVLVAVAAVMACGSPVYASEKTYHRVSILEPQWSSGHVVSLSFKLGFESSDFTQPTPAQLTPQMQLWDITNAQQVTFVLQQLPQGDPFLEIAMKPKLAFIPGHRYGVRASSDSVYTGLTGNRELGAFYIGTWPRVSGMMFKGGRTLYLSFTEPVERKAMETAVTLTNSQTKKQIAAVYKDYGGPPTNFFNLNLNGGAFDVAVEHTLRISKAASSARGAGLDGSNAGPGQPASDFVMKLSPAQLDVFVNGYPRNETLQIRCINPTGWWDHDSDKPVVPRDECVQVSPAQSGGAGGCSVHGGRADVDVMVALVLFLVVVQTMRRRRRTGP